MGEREVKRKKKDKREIRARNDESVKTKSKMGNGTARESVVNIPRKVIAKDE